MRVPDLGVMNLTHTNTRLWFDEYSVMGNNCVKKYISTSNMDEKSCDFVCTTFGVMEILFAIFSRSNMVVSNYDPDKDFGCVHCDIDLRDMTLNQGDETTGSWTVLWNIVHIQLGQNEFIWPRNRCMPCYLNNRDMVFGQGNGTALDHGQHLCEMLFRSYKWLRSYDPDKIVNRRTDRKTDRGFLYTRNYVGVW